MNLAGQVYNPQLFLKDANGKSISHTPENWEEKLASAEKATFSATIGSRTAYATEDEKLIFTEVVAHQKGLVKTLYKNFGKPEHKGKWILLSGHMSEREWTPDPTKQEHLKYCRKETITRADLEGLGFKFAEGNAKEKVSFYVPIPQKQRQIVASGFEFIGNADSSASTSSEKPASRSRFIADDDDTPANQETVPAGAKNEEDPF